VIDADDSVDPWPKPILHRVQLGPGPRIHDRHEIRLIFVRRRSALLEVANIIVIIGDREEILIQRPGHQNPAANPDLAKASMQREARTERITVGFLMRGDEDGGSGSKSRREVGCRGIRLIRKSKFVPRMAGVLSVSECGHRVTFANCSKKRSEQVRGRSGDQLFTDDRTNVGEIPIDLSLKGGQIVVAILTTEASVKFGIETPSIIVEFAVPVEDMDLGHPRRRLESRLGADADRRRSSRAIGEDRHASEDAISRKKSTFQIEIRRRDADGPPSLVTLDDFSMKDVRAAEQAGRILNSSKPEELPNRRTPSRHHVAVLKGDRKFLLHSHRETSNCPEFLQRGDGSLTTAAKSKVRSLDHPVRGGP
jgi:hypothetical protein